MHDVRSHLVSLLLSLHTSPELLSGTVTKGELPGLTGQSPVLIRGVPSASPSMVQMSLASMDL